LYSHNITTSSIVPCKPLHTHINPEKKNTETPIQTPYKTHNHPHAPGLGFKEEDLTVLGTTAGGWVWIMFCFFFEWLFNGYLMAVLWGYHCFLIMKWMIPSGNVSHSFGKSSF